MRTDGQAELTKLTVALRNFVKAPRNEEDLLYITPLALESHPKSSRACDFFFITDCCKVKNVNLKVSSNDTISVPSLVKIGGTL